jgi:ATP-dependent DNA helicase RecQ
MTTFGIGKDLSAVAWRDLMDQLLFEGLLAEDPNDGRPLVRLGDAEGVRAVYRGERRVMLRKLTEDAPSRASKTRQTRMGGASLEVPIHDRALFEALRNWRKSEAARQHVPPYVIFHDRTLLDIASGRPTTSSALAKTGGVGQGKLDRYGEAVLKVVRDTE